MIDINEITIKDFFEKVTEMYEHNLVHYPDEKPSIDGAFKEVLLKCTEDFYNEGKKFMRASKWAELKLKIR